MIPRWRLASLRWLVRHPWQLGLAFVGVALGVSVAVAVDLATTSAERAFELSMDRITGEASHRIIGPPRGLDEDFYRRLRIEHGVRASTPVIEGFAEWRGQTLRVLGVDPLARTGAADRLGAVEGKNLETLLTEPDTVLLAERTAHRHGVGPGDQVTVRIGGAPQELRVIGLIDGAGKPDAALAGLAIADIANAQSWFARYGRIDYIDLHIDPEQVKAIEANLPAGLRLESAGARTRQAREMSLAFRTNLDAMGLLAIVVGIFLIYNIITFSVVQRRRLIGTLRTLGVTRGMIFGQIIGETLLLGAAGTVTGLLVGLALAHGLVGLVTRTINDLYFVLTVRELIIDPVVLVEGAVIGLATALVAALGPAVEAASAPPEAAGRRSVIEHRATRAVPTLAAVGALLLLVAAGLPLLPGGGLIAGFGALLALTLGSACLVPAAIYLLVPPAAALLGRLAGPLGRLTARGILAALSRTGLAVLALTVALAATVGVGVMIDSFRGTVERWLERKLTADLYLSGADRVAARHFAPLPEGLAERVRVIDGVEAISTSWRVEVDTPSGPTPLLALDPAPGSLDSFHLKHGEPEAVWPRFRTGEAVLVSEPWAQRHEAQPGDRVTMLTARGSRSVPIASVYYDYNTDRGIVLMHRDLYNRWWPDRPVSSIGVFVADAASLDTLTARLQSLIEDVPSVRLRASEEIRRQALEVFDRTFRITSVLRLLALVVAFVGVVTALLALELERTREIAILRTSGATPGQVRGHILGQTALMGLLAGLLSLPLGLALAELLIDVINQRAFGWSIGMRLPPEVTLEALGLALGAAILAGIWPAWRAGNIEPADALREE